MPHCEMGVLSTDGKDVVVVRRTILTTIRYRISGEQPYVLVRMSGWFKTACIAAAVAVATLVLTLSKVELGAGEAASLFLTLALMCVGATSMISRGVLDTIQDNAREAAREVASRNV